MKGKPQVKEIKLGICPLCCNANLMAYRLQYNRYTTAIVIACEACDLYPDDVQRGCSHLGSEGNSYFTQDHGGGCATMMLFTSTAKLPTKL